MKRISTLSTLLILLSCSGLQPKRELSSLTNESKCNEDIEASYFSKDYKRIESILKYCDFNPNKQFKGSSYNLLGHTINDNNFKLFKKLMKHQNISLKTIGSSHIKKISLDSVRLAIKNNNKKILRYLIEKKPEVLEEYTRYGDKRNLFFDVLDTNNPVEEQKDMIDFLIKKKYESRTFAYDHYYSTSVPKYLISRNKINLFRYLLKKSADLYGPDDIEKQLEVSVKIAVTTGNLEILKLLIEEYEVTNINHTDHLRDHVLHIAIDKGYTEIAKYIININQIDLNIKHNSGKKFSVSPLINSIMSNNFEVFEILVQDERVDVNLNRRDDEKYFRNALYFSLKKKNTKYLELLLKRKDLVIDNPMLACITSPLSLAISSKDRLKIDLIFSHENILSIVDMGHEKWSCDKNVGWSGFKPIDVAKEIGDEYSIQKISELLMQKSN